MGFDERFVRRVREEFLPRLSLRFVEEGSEDDEEEVGTVEDPTSVSFRARSGREARDSPEVLDTSSSLFELDLLIHCVLSFLPRILNRIQQILDLSTRSDSEINRRLDLLSRSNRTQEVVYDGVGRTGRARGVRGEGGESVHVGEDPALDERDKDLGACRSTPSELTVDDDGAGFDVDLRDRLDDFSNCRGGDVSDGAGMEWRRD